MRRRPVRSLVAIRLAYGPFTGDTALATSNSRNLNNAELTIDTLDQSLSGLRVTLSRAKTFRKQLRNILGVPKDGSVVQSVRAMKARLAVLESRQAAFVGLLREAA